MTMPDLPQGPYGPPPEQPQPRKRHRVRNTILAVSGGLVVIVVLAATLGGSKTPATPAAVNTPSAHAAVTTAPTTTPALSAGDQEFVTAIRSALAKGGYSSTGTDAQLASVGTQICGIRRGRRIAGRRDRHHRRDRAREQVQHDRRQTGQDRGA